MPAARYWLLVLALLMAIGSPARAESTYVKFLKAGKVPPERMGAILGLIAKNGEADDLAYVLERATKADGFPVEIKPLAFDALLSAATDRNLKPAGDLSALTAIIANADAKLAKTRLTAVKLAGLWKVAAVAGDLEKLATAKEASPALRTAAIEALGAIGGPAANETFAKLAAKGNPLATRALAVAGIAQHDVNAAAKQAILVLADLSDKDDPGALIDAFLAEKNGSATLAKVLSEAKLSPDAAKLALRHLYAVGRTDDELVAALSAAAGISTEVKPLTPEELKRLVGEVAAKGDAARGELIFRRAELSCIKCHAVSGAGGNIGPELSAVGQVSPSDYIITSILTPELSVKEEFQLVKVLTSEGKLHVGLLKEDNPDRLVLKDSEGRMVIIPKDGDEEIIRGGSLMPKGLSNFLTQGEFFDLVKFVSQLGKPEGPYPVRSQPTMQRWRVLSPVGENLVANVPDEGLFKSDVLEATTWYPAYAKVNGQLPLGDVRKLAISDVLYLQGEINVTTAGKVQVQIDAPGGVSLWLDEAPLKLATPVDVEPGVHKVTLRVDTKQRDAAELKLLVQPAAEGAAEYTVVGGP